MAFGDHSRVQNAIDYQGGLSQNWLNNLRDILVPQNQNIWNRYQVAADRADQDYSNIQDRYNQTGQQYQNYLNGPGISYNPSNQNFGAYGGYENFANTGGYSPQDIQNIRARANAPMRATYANAQADLDRRNVLAGGNLANYAAAKAQMARQLSYALGDQSLNTEAQLAQDIRSGKLAGLGGMTGIDTSKMGEGLANAAQNLQAQGMDSSRILSLLSGQNAVNSGLSNLYGTTPGLANMYGNQSAKSNDQLLQTQQFQQALMQSILQGVLGMSQVPGNYQQALGNISSTLNLAGQVGGLLSPLGGVISKAGIPGLPGGTAGSF